MDPAPVAWPEVLQPLRAQRIPNVANDTDVCLDTSPFFGARGCTSLSACYLCANLPVEIQYCWITAIWEISSLASQFRRGLPFMACRGSGVRVSLAPFSKLTAAQGVSSNRLPLFCCLGPSLSRVKALIPSCFDTGLPLESVAGQGFSS